MLPGVLGLQRVLGEVAAERRRQEQLFPGQRIPDGTHPSYLGLAAQARASCNLAVSSGHLTWLHVLEEQVWEAFAETDEARLRAELIQVAAVAVRWVEALDRRPDGRAAA